MESVFQFSNPQLLKCTFELNGDFKKVDGQKVDVPQEFNLQIGEIEESDDVSSATIVLELNLGNDDTNCPFKMNIVEGAKFRWKRDGYDEDRIQKLIHQNAPALLLSYIRPIVVYMTENSPYPAFHLPFIDFTKVFPVDGKILKTEDIVEN